MEVTSAMGILRPADPRHPYDAHFTGYLVIVMISLRINTTGSAMVSYSFS